MVKVNVKILVSAIHVVSLNGKIQVKRKIHLQSLAQTNLLVPKWLQKQQISQQWHVVEIPGWHLCTVQYTPPLNNHRKVVTTQPAADNKVKQ